MKKNLNPAEDMSHDVDFSSMTHDSKIGGKGDGVFKDSNVTLSMDHDEDDNLEDFNNISREIQFNESRKMLKNYSKKSIESKNMKSNEKFEYYQAKEEVYDPKMIDSISTTKAGIQNMVISDQIKAVIEENKKKESQDLENYVNREIMPEKEQPDPNKNMINLENILIIEKKISEISDGINTMVEINLLCEDWWEVTQEETMLMNLGDVFKEPRYKAILKQATLCE